MSRKNVIEFLKYESIFAVDKSECKKLDDKLNNATDYE